MDRENGTYGGDMFSSGERELEDAALACTELELTNDTARVGRN